ncbi:hypothetical protein [Gordoniibacillus kamchatkensis]|uniref:hypothetical protein n=1 Tax=Gordoniibacillus kamchatkensis TaxID=1590651 RepID=UPI0006966562|nr:hypothetical protein [Paenibacillus sp. VKM B-2647]
MNRPATFVALTYIIVFAAFAATLAGCERQAAVPGSASADRKLSGTEASFDTASSRRSASGGQEQAAAGKDSMHISSTAGPDTGTAAAAPIAAPAGKPVGKSEAAQSPAQSAKPHVEAKDAYKEGKPTLLGLALKTPKDDVLAKLGAAKNKFVMDDDADPITVYDYTDFSVGFNKNDTLEFVDVRSADIDPGLHGLRLGQKLEDAVAALGKPDTNTSYVLTYKSEGRC